jgi:hypothetical protein
VSFFLAAYALGSTEFDLPAGPPIVAALSVLVLFAAMTQIARRRS